MTYLLSVAGWVLLLCFVVAICKAGATADESFEELCRRELERLNHLDRPVNVDVNRIMYANKRAWKQDILN